MNDDWKKLLGSRLAFEVLTSLALFQPPDDRQNGYMCLAQVSFADGVPVWVHVMWSGDSGAEYYGTHEFHVGWLDARTLTPVSEVLRFAPLP